MINSENEKFPVIFIQFDSCFIFQLIRIRVDFFEIGPYNTESCFLGGVTDPQNPSASRNKQRERKKKVRVWRGGGGRRAECDIGVHLSSSASHPVRVTVVDLKTSASPYSNRKERNVLGETKFRLNVLYHQSRLR